MSSNDPIDAERFRRMLCSPRADEALERLKKRSAEAEAEPLGGYPENKAEVSYPFEAGKDAVTISIVRNDSMEPYVKSFYCGYVRFPRTMLQSELFTCFVPVHGGISFDKSDTDGSHVYGFDCAHAGDDMFPVPLPGAGGQPQQWRLPRVKAECERLATAISIAAKWEKGFLACPSGDEWRERRIGSIERCHAELRKKGIVFDLTDNFGAMIKVLFGEV